MKISEAKDWLLHKGFSCNEKAGNTLDAELAVGGGEHTGKITVGILEMGEGLSVDLHLVHNTKPTIPVIACPRYLVTSIEQFEFLITGSSRAYPFFQ